MKVNVIHLPILFLLSVAVIFKAPTSSAFQIKPVQRLQEKTTDTYLYMSDREASRRKFLIGSCSVISSLFAPIESPYTTTEIGRSPLFVWAATGTATVSSISTDPDPVTFGLIPQFCTVDDVPAYYFEDRRYIYAFVERVIDGDTLRVRHIPGYTFGQKVQPLDKQGISKETLSIRVYAIDTPETGKNKRKTSQPLGKEAEAFTTGLVYHKMVKITFLRKDQYNRAVARVETLDGLLPRSGPKDLSMELAKAGLAELYTGGGAEYYGKKQEFQQAIAQAKKERKGIWSLDDRVSAAEYKRAEREGIPIASIIEGREETVRTYVTISSPPKLDPVLTPSLPVRTMKKQTIAHDLLDLAITGLELAPI